MNDRDPAEAIDLAIGVYKEEIRRLTQMKYTMKICHHPRASCIDYGTIKTGYIYFCPTCMNILKKPPPKYVYEPLVDGDVTSKSRQQVIDRKVKQFL